MTRAMTYLSLKETKAGQVIGNSQGNGLVQAGACASNGDTDNLHGGNSVGEK
jgi:hypothetical protein